VSGKIQIFEKSFAIGANTEATISLLESKQGLFLQLQTQKGGDTEDAIVQSKTSIPAALLPEMKRAINEVERILSDRGELDDYDNGLAYQRSRSSIFANESEQEFARILDFYKISWDYEPTTFPIAWDEEGYVRESFTPDFFLPEQSLVTKKNRKVRLFEQHYPDIPIKLFYGKDYKALLAKFGIPAYDAEPETKNDTVKLESFEDDS
jgi:hypoxanthine phosphoribosyltransferase